MSLMIGKHYAFLFLLFLCATFAPTVSAQIINSKQTSAAESRSQISETETGAAAAEKTRIEKMTNAPNAFQSGDKLELNVFENKNDAVIAKGETESLSAKRQNAISDFAYHFPSIEKRKRRIDFDDSPGGEKDELSLRSSPANFRSLDDTKNAATSTLR